MSKLPYMQLYVDNFVCDTTHLTTEQVGAYMLLLAAMWKQGGELPNDPKILARIARIAPARWSKISGLIMAFFTVEGEKIQQERLKEEHKKAIQLSQKRIQSGKRGGQAKALKNNNQGLASASVLPEHRAPVSEPDLEELGTDVPSSKTSPPLRSGDDTKPDLEIIDGGKTYAFESGVIKLNKSDLAKWSEAYPDVSVKAELLSMTDWAGRQGKNWFHAVSGALAKRQRETRLELERIRVQAATPEFKPHSCRMGI